jgi:nucleotide-binding universal stress UspA family protein
MAYNNILVPLDGSDIAEKALPYAKAIAKLKNSNLTLYAVSLSIFVDKRDRLFTSYLEVNAGELNAEGINTTTAIGNGDTAEQIIKYADENKFDLIVMATHGYSGAKRWMFGSVTQKVLYGTSIPVLLVKGKSSESVTDFNKILVPVDGSPFSESTFPYVIELTENTDKEVLLLHICEPPVVPSYGSRPINEKWARYRDEMWEEVEKLSEMYMEKITADMTSKGIKARSMIVKALTGEVAKTIMQVKKDENIDLTIIATQGRTGVNRLVYGNVVNKIVEEGSKPIMLIRPAPATPHSAPQNLLDDIWNGYLSHKA